MSASPDAIAAEWPAVLAFVLTRMEGHADAEDVAAQAIERALVHAGQYQPREGATLRSWLYTIARNTVTDHWRRRRVQTGPLVEFGRATTDAGNARHLADIDAHAAISRLDAWQRDLCHAVLDGHSSLHACYALGIARSKPSAHRRNYAVRTALRPALEAMS